MMPLFAAALALSSPMPAPITETRVMEILEEADTWCPLLTKGGDAAGSIEKYLAAKGYGATEKLIFFYMCKSHVGGRIDGLKIGMGRE